MTDILDEAGTKIGETRPGQYLDNQLTHAIPVIDPKTGEQASYVDEDGKTVLVWDYAPIGSQRAEDQLAAQGLVHVGNGRLEPAADVVEITPGDVAPVPA